MVTLINAVWTVWTMGNYTVDLTVYSRKYYQETWYDKTCLH